MDKTTNTLLFSTGCSINTIVEANETNNGVIIFVTGDFGESHKTLRLNPAIIKLKERFSSVFFDNRATGESHYPLLGKINATYLSDDIKCVVNYTKQTFPNQPIYLFTSSYGTIPVMIFLNRFKKSVDKVIIDSPILWPACPKIIEETMDIWKKNAKRLLTPELADIIHNYHSTAEGLFELVKSEEMRRFISANVPITKGTETLSFYFAMQDFIVSCDLRQIISELSEETLILLGAKDRVSPASITKETVGIYKNWKVCLSEFRDYGHKIYNQNSDEFARICSEFYL